MKTAYCPLLTAHSRTQQSTCSKSPNMRNLRAAYRFREIAA